MQLSISLVILLLATYSLGQDPIVELTISYCPTLYTGAGAVVAVNTRTGAWNITRKFSWPEEIFGCPANYDPAVTYDAKNNNLFLMFGEDFGYTIVINTVRGEVIHKTAARDPLFVGFINMAFDGVNLIGEEPSGKDDGEFQFARFHPITGAVKAQEYLPFRALMDDSHFFDQTKSKYWVQGSYDKRKQKCAPQDSDNCLLEINSDTGALLSAKFTNWTVYKYGNSLDEQGNVLGFLEGFTELCKHPYNNFLFAKVNLNTATAKPIGCIDKDLSIQMDEWISTFSKDEKLFATGSRIGGNAQFLVLDPTSGKTLLNSKLDGLADALGTTLGLYWIWSVDFAN